MATPMLNCCSFQKGMYLPNGVGPTDSCPPIIQTVADILDAVAGTVEGQLTVERYVDLSGDQHIHLYEWNGVAWVEWIDTSFRPVDGLFDEMLVISLDNGWQVSLDQGATWNTDPVNVPIDPPSATVEVWFRNVQTGCIYTNIPQIPLQNPCFQGVVIYPDFASIPAGVMVGEPAMVADNTNFAPFLIRSIYLWDGAVWNLMLELQFLDAPTFTNVFVNALKAGWEFQLNGGDWDDPNFAETNLVTVNFRQISSQCEYQNDNVVPS